jgi:O-antigen/teichoic acid export membrane protein
MARLSTGRPTPATRAPAATQAGADVRTHAAQEQPNSAAAVLLTGATLAAGGLNYGYAVLVGRWLTPGEFVGYASVAAMLLAAGTLAEASLPWLLAREVVRSHSAVQRRQAVTMTVAASVAQGAVAAGVSAALAAHLHQPPGAGVIALTAVCMVVLFPGSTLIGYVQGVGRFRAIAGIRLLEAGVKVGLGVALMRAGLGVLGALGGILAADLAALAVAATLARADLRWHPARLGEGRLWRDSGSMTLLQGLLAAVVAADTVTIGALGLGAPETAGYQLAVVLSRGPQFVSAAVALVAFTALVGQNRRRALAVAIRTYALVAVPGALLVALVPRALLTAVFPGLGAHAAAVLAWTALSGLMVGLLGLLVAACQARMLIRSSAAVLGVAVVTEPVVVTVAAHAGGVSAVAACVAAALTLTAAGLAVVSIRNLSTPERPQ